jgi:3-deoxy-D-arabino-heptulosonate 7-phosphate (DAHP) synthase
VASDSAVLSDGEQSLHPAQFEALMQALAPAARALGRSL